MAAQASARGTRARDAKATAAPAIVAIRKGGDKPPLFLIHGVDGTMRPLRRLVEHLEPDQPIYGVISQAFLAEEIVLMRVEEQAAYYLEAIQTLCPQGPYYFLGLSFGGFLAFEIAQRLHARGELVGMLGMLDNLLMGSEVKPAKPSWLQSKWMRRVKLIAGHLAHLVKPDPVHYFKIQFRTRILKAAYNFLYARGRAIPRFLRRPIDINWFAARRYKPGFYPGRVTLFQTVASASRPHATSGLWAGLAGEGVEIVEVPGTHDNFLREPNVQLLAKAVTVCLRKYQGSMPSVRADDRVSKA